jgi:hypothetical protein
MTEPGERGGERSRAVAVHPLVHLRVPRLCSVSSRDDTKSNRFTIVPMHVPGSQYEGRRRRLGEDSLGALEATLEGIRRQPGMHTAVYQSYRRALVRRFPYGVFYESSEATAIVNGVFHFPQDSQKWRERFPD